MLWLLYSIEDYLFKIAFSAEDRKRISIGSHEQVCKWWLIIKTAQNGNWYYKKVKDVTVWHWTVSLHL